LDLVTQLLNDSKVLFSRHFVHDLGRSRHLELSDCVEGVRELGGLRRALRDDPP
jgi:hypothetical protein